MDFGLSPDQIDLRDAVRRVARRDLAPGYLERAKSTEFPWEAYRRIARLGVLGLLAGPEHNPLDREDHVAAGLAVEELAYADFNLANAVIPVLLTSSLIARSGTAWMRERWLARLVGGETYLAFGLTEPHSGSDAAALRTTATADGDGYLLTGEKTSVTMLAHAEAMLVTAQTVRDGVSLGVSGFLVDLSAHGIATSGIPDTGWRPMGRGIVHFDDVRVPASARIGAEGAAFRSVLAGFDFTRPLLALTGIGCAHACVDQTASYVADREAFDAPLASFEGVSFPLAEHSTTSARPSAGPGDRGGLTDGDASVDRDGLPGQLRRSRPAQEDDQRREVLRLRDPQVRQRRGLLEELPAEPVLQHHLGRRRIRDQRRREDVDPYPVPLRLDRRHLAEHHDRRHRRPDHALAGGRHLRGVGGDVHDAAAALLLHERQDDPGEQHGRQRLLGEDHRQVLGGGPVEQFGPVGSCYRRDRDIDLPELAVYRRHGLVHLIGAARVGGHEQHLSLGAPGEHHLARGLAPRRGAGEQGDLPHAGLGEADRTGQADARRTPGDQRYRVGVAAHQGSGHGLSSIIYKWRD
jgi:cyclohexanecarboxyl-CoA dehydrogenase